MASRVMTYLGLLHEDLIRKNHLIHGLLPPVLPIVLYNGGAQWSAATEIDALTTKIYGLDTKYCPKLSYMLIDESTYDAAELESRNNPVATFFLLENAQAKELCLELIIRLADMLAPNAELLRTFLLFADKIYFEGRIEVDRMYQKGIDNKEVRTMLQEKAARFIQKWKAEGEREERRRVAEKMLRAGMPTSQIIDFTNLSEEEIARIRQSIAN